jgi:hypothetical protein
VNGIKNALQIGRLKKKWMVGSEPPKPKLRKRVKAYMRQTTVLNAIDGSGGCLTVVAKRLNTTAGMVNNILKKPGWEMVANRFADEREMRTWKCEDNVFSIANYSTDDNVRLRANQFILEKMHPDYKPVNKLTIEGGDKPIQHQHILIQLPAEILNAPLENRIQALEYIDAKRQELNDNQPST